LAQRWNCPCGYGGKCKQYSGDKEYTCWIFLAVVIAAVSAVLIAAIVAAVIHNIRKRRIEEEENELAAA